MFYTDFPISGNESGQEVQLNLLAYDRNKYVTVKFQDYEDSVKSGYIYKYVSGKKKFLSKRDVMSLPISVKGIAPSRKSIEEDIKCSRKRKTTYTVWIGTNKRDFYALKSVLKYVIHKMKSTSEDIYVSRCVKSKYSWNTTPIFEIEGRQVFEYGRNGVARSSGWLSKKNYRNISGVAYKRCI